MKKLMFAAVAVFAFGIANAQDLVSKKGENYLPEAGDWAISFNADGIFEYIGNSFNGNTNNNAPNVNYIRNNSFVGKKFITDKNAYRVIANLGFGSSTNTAPVGTNTSEIKNTGFDLAAGLGKEWRKGTTRLQGFYGADALLTANSSSTETTDTDTTTGAFVSSVESKSGLALGLGVQGFLGAEYFIFPKFAIGAQYTYRVGFDLRGKSETTTQFGTSPSTTTDGGKSSNFGLGNVGIASMNLTLHF
ncbi:hypothetical protein FLGE108171_13775 [Flavobacterium gelidilacus]|uniref:hypothetical protein n=1 Tax=Flavobacterium gelidilacus TaxID=206041 RepID=UPI0004122B80|nr:hypothetical protein [Flavobacterium gelidilacus]